MESSTALASAHGVCLVCASVRDLTNRFDHSSFPEETNPPQKRISQIFTNRATTISAVSAWLLSFSINAMAVTPPVGATKGSLDVTTRGSASYTIPVVVPPGTRGMQPNLALVYDSQAGNGFIGHGWSLRGLSVIQRCGATILLDTFRGGVNYDGNDRFCLDGERLVNVGGNEYRTQHETWQRVFATGGTVSNPASFIVWSKDGSVLEYGVTADSQVLAQGSTEVRAWALDKVTDVLGNYYTIQYQQDNANGDYRPISINYTGNASQGLSPYNSIVFQYQARTDIPLRYEAGSVIKSMQRLTHVVSYTGQIPVRNYHLTYDNNGAAGRSRLTSVQECGTDGVCLPPTQFTWQNGSVNWSATPLQFSWDANNGTNGPIGFADINGDGKQDFYGWGSDGNIHVRLWGANGFGNETTFAWSTSKTTDGPIGFADINGDGRADFWGWSHDGNIYVRISNGDGTFANATSIPWSTTKSNGPVGFADINGDGCADFWGWNSDGNIDVRLSNCDGTFQGVQSTNYGAGAGTVVFADVNGDGRADLVMARNGTMFSILWNGQTIWFTSKSVVVRLSNGNGTFGPELPVYSGSAVQCASSSPSSCPTPSFISIGDINGDGNADVDGYLSMGSGSFLAGGLVGGGFVDINGDGKDDAYTLTSPQSPSANSTCATISFSNGDGTFSVGPSIPCSTSANPGFTDINGDGLADLYDWTAAGSVRVFLANPVMPDLITSITNGLDEQRGLVYKPLSNELVYSPAPVQTYPYVAVQDKTHVVSAMQKSDGLGNLVTTSYTYHGLLWHATANERLGFGWIQRVDPDQSYTTDEYNLDIDRFGTLHESWTYVPWNNADVMVKHTLNTWETGTSADARIMNRLMGSTVQTYELDGTLTTQTTTSTVYDGYGYPTSTTVTQLDGRQKTTTDTYPVQDNPSWNLSPWILGLKGQEQVTAVAPGLTSETRTKSYTYYPTSGLLWTETTEPNNSNYTLLKSYGYDAFGNLYHTTISGPGIVARTPTTTYDSIGRFLTQTTNALSQSDLFVYDPRNGQPTQHTDPNNLITTWNYDGFGRILGEQRPDTTSSTFNFAACGSSCPPYAVTSLTTTASGKGATISYIDMLGREVMNAKQGFNGAWIYKSTIYDALGRPAQVSLPYFAGETPLYTVNQYDALQRVYQTTAPGNRVTTTTYNGLRTTIMNPLNQPTTTAKDSEGHVVDVADAALGHTYSSFDAFGNLVQITDPAGNLTTMKYDRLGRKLELTDPDRGHWVYTYDVLGELNTQTDAALQVTTFTYDTLGRITSRSAPEGTTTWSYDFGSNKPIGKLFSVSAPNYAEWHSYDQLGRESQTSQYIGGVYYSVTKSFDAYSQLDVLTYPTGYTLKHVYDPYGNLIEVKDNQNGQSYWQATAANARGQITTEQLAGATMTTTHAYDPNTGYPSYDYTDSPGGVEVRRGMYSWDNVGNLTWRLYEGSSYIMESFGYDSLNRLTSVTGPVNKSFRYDVTGNLTTKSDVGTYYYNGSRPHAVNLILGNNNSWQFQYDANGNLLTGNGQTVTYTSFNQPATITSGSTTTKFKYGADYQRIIKNANGVPTRYTGSSLHEAVINGTTVTNRHYIYAGKYPIAIYSYDVPSGGSPTNLAVKYLHHDAIGSIEATTDAAGNVLERLAYDAWGKRRNTNGTDATTAISPAVKLGYTAQEHDDELGLINLKAREYDPYFARFLQPDPLKEKGDPHPYAYARNNPLKYTDPTGTSYVDPFGDWSSSNSSPSYQSWSQSDEGFYQQIADARAMDSWSQYNTSSPNCSFCSSGQSPTNLNISNSDLGGMGGNPDAMHSVGAGIPTGAPDFSRMGSTLTGASLGVDTTRSLMSISGTGIAQGANGPYSMSLSNGNVTTTSLKSMSAGLEVAGRGLFFASAINDYKNVMAGTLNGGEALANVGVGAVITFGGLNPLDALTAGAIYEAGKGVSNCGPCMDVLTEPYFIP